MAMRTTKSADRILDDLLRVLVRRWGYHYVFSRLGALKGSDTSPGESGAGSDNGSKRRRLTPSDYIERIDVSSPKKNVLLQLARKFENREFLPTLGHIKDFLGTRNVHMDSLRGRSDAFVKIAEILVGLPEDNLQTMLNDENYSGPSRLGPLSDAIKARGAAIRFSK